MQICKILAEWTTVPRAVESFGRLERRVVSKMGDSVPVRFLLPPTAEQVARTVEVASKVVETINRRSDDDDGLHLLAFGATSHKDSWRHDMLKDSHIKEVNVDTDDYIIKLVILNAFVIVYVARQMSVLDPSLGVAIKLQRCLCEITIDGKDCASTVSRSCKSELNSVILHVANMSGEREDDMACELTLHDDGSVSFAKEGNSGDEEGDKERDERDCEDDYFFHDCNTSIYVHKILSAVDSFREEEEKKESMEECFGRILRQGEIVSAFTDRLSRANF